MASYYVNKQAQNNGGHDEVHTSDCPHMPAVGIRLYLGEFASCHGAVREAKRHYSKVNGCRHFSPECHNTPGV